MRFILILIPLLALGGCDRSPSPPAPPRKLSVVATVYPLADIARQVGADLVDVSWVIESGQSMKGVQPDELLRNRLRTADLVLMGDVTEAWATEGSGEGEHYARILRLETLPSARQSGHRGFLWLDPLIVKDGVNELSTRLSALRPRYAPEIAERAAALAAKIDALNDEYQPRFRTAQNRRLMVLSNDFAPLLQRFSLLAVPTLDQMPSQLTNEDIRLLQYVSRQNNTKLLVIPSDTPAAVVDDLRVRSGLQPVLLDPLGTSASRGPGTYLDLLRWNLDQLYRATTIQ